MWRRPVGFGTLLVFALLLSQPGSSQTPSQTGAQRAAAPAASEPANPERTVWYFYRVKWGKQDQFLDLFQKNHYPILKAQLGSRLSGVKTYVPTYHGDGRADWTFAVAITFKDAAALTSPSQEEDIARKLFKNFETFRDEEHTRFELLDAHWDVPLNEVNFETRRPSSRR